jgi:glyoxylase-like metal-dependent hydrolase (beta-lactamase superfamily II)
MPRSFLFAALSIALFGSTMSAITPVTAHAAVPQVKTLAPGFYRVMLGDFEVTVLSDGTAPRQVDEIMSKPDEIRQTLARAHEALPIELSINAFLINTGAQLILVDTGAGELFGPHSGGRLIANLRAAGYQPEQIDAVLLTHIHGDHSGGLSIGGQRVFPNALVYVDKRDAEFWLSAAEERAVPAERRKTFQQSHATVGPYVAAGKLRPFDGARELFPGIRAMPAYGHTPGHTAYMVESKGQRLLLWGDIIHVAEVQFPDPDITIDYDVNPDAAITSRKRLLADAAEQGFLVGGAHISFPGLGHVRADAQGYSWIALPYSALR